MNKRQRNGTVMRAGDFLAGTTPYSSNMRRTRSLPLSDSVPPCLLESHMVSATDAFPDTTPADQRHTSRNKQETPEFFATPYAGRFAWFLMDLKSNMANFFCTVGHFCFSQKKISEFTKRIFGCEFGIFFCQTKKCPTVGKKVRHVRFQVHQKSSKSARIENVKKLLKLGTPIEISTKCSGLVHACLDSSEEIDFPSSNVHNFSSFASIGLIFCLNRSRIRWTIRKTKPQRAFCAPPGGAVRWCCCVDCVPSVSCLFLLVINY